MFLIFTYIHSCVGCYCCCCCCCKQSSEPVATYVRPYCSAGAQPSRGAGVTNRPSIYHLPWWASCFRLHLADGSLSAAYYGVVAWLILTSFTLLIRTYKFRARTSSLFVAYDYCCGTTRTSLRSTALWWEASILTYSTRSLSKFGLAAAFYEYIYISSAGPGVPPSGVRCSREEPIIGELVPTRNTRTHARIRTYTGMHDNDALLSFAAPTLSPTTLLLLRAYTYYHIVCVQYEP